MIRRTLILLLAGLGVGMVLSMIYGPEFIAWWNRPTVATPFSCDPQILGATRQLVNMQLGSGALIGIVFAIIGNYIAKRRAAKTEVPAAQPTPVIAPKP